MNEIKISVRDLTGFVLRHGSIDSGRGTARDPDAMKEGIRLHQKYQQSQNEGYKAEVPLSDSLSFYEYKESGEDFYRAGLAVKPYIKEPVISLTVEGRADGITEAGGIEEIKCMLSDVRKLREPEPLHLAQAKAYAAIFSHKNSVETITVRMIYISIEKEYMKTFEYSFDREELWNWFVKLSAEYCKWQLFLLHHREERNASIKLLQFPFPYREGQEKLVKDCYRTILREKKLFLMAPTGTGKTAATFFPAVKALGEGLSEKIFYLTAKTITRSVAEHTAELFSEQGASLSCLTLTARDKICIFEKSDCNPIKCPRANGHYDRINDCLFDLIRHENKIDRICIEKYAEKYKVCPFELGLDASVWADAVICDYNYAFDPNVYLRRFFDETGHDYIFLIDEAHNLVERAREMYSAELSDREIRYIAKLVSTKDKEDDPERKHFNELIEKLKKKLMKAASEITKAVPSDEEITRLEAVPASLISAVESAMTAYEKIFAEANRDFNSADFHEAALMLYFALRDFVNAADVSDEHYIEIGKMSENGSRSVKYSCIDPSANLSVRYADVRSVIFFSATLLPVSFYEAELGGDKEDYAVYAPSPFDKKNSFIGIAGDISTRYRDRNDNLYKRIADCIIQSVREEKGNYMAFFPSYGFMNNVLPFLQSEKKITLLPQSQGMSEEEREKFLAAFEKTSDRCLLGLCVMGGVFSEGIDLTGDRLIGAFIIGPGLPLVSKERELMRDFFERKNPGTGFNYAYLYPGMNKVLQAAGRVIRTAEDRGIIILLDDRFTAHQYRELFPREWDHAEQVKMKDVPDRLSQFWKSL